MMNQSNGDDRLTPRGGAGLTGGCRGCPARSLRETSCRWSSRIWRRWSILSGQPLKFIYFCCKTDQISQMTD